VTAPGPGPGRPAALAPGRRLRAAASLTAFPLTLEWLPVPGSQPRTAGRRLNKPR